MTLSRMASAALITNTYAPYRAPVWAGLGRGLKSLDVVLLSQMEGDRIWSVRHEEGYTLHVLDGLRVFMPRLDTTLYLGSGIIAKLRSIRPTCIIVGGVSQVPYIQSILWAKRNGIPVVQWYESHGLSSRMKRGPVAWLRGYLLRMASALAVPGMLCRDYMLGMGIPEARISLAPNVVDVNLFAPQGARPPLGGILRILYLGRYIPLKQVPLLIEAVRHIGGANVTLRLVGYGPQEAALRALSSDLGCVEFLPPTHSPQESARHYAWADVVVLPSSREVWGLVVNEALASGCYVISSVRAGATPDLVLQAPLDVGRGFDPADGAMGLAGLLSDVATNISAIRERRSAIQNWGRQFGPDTCVRGLLAAVSMAVESNAS